MSKFACLFRGALVLCCLGLSTLALAQKTYSCANYSVFTVTANASTPQGSGVNGLDTVVGFFFDTSVGQTRGFLRSSAGTGKIYNVPGAMTTYLYGINDSGVVVGTYDTHGFTRTGTAVTTIDYPGDPYTTANGINSNGDVVGSGSNGSTVVAYELSDGQFTTLQYPGATSTIATGISDGGVIVGRYFLSDLKSHGFVYQNGAYTSIDYSGALNTAVGGINNSGVIVGSYTNAQGKGGAFAYKGGHFRSISVPNYVSTSILSINNKGDITGSVTDSSGTVKAMLGTSCR